MDADLRDAAREYLARCGGGVFPNLFRSAKGTIVQDSQDREYLNCTSGQMCAMTGHYHPAIVAAVHRAGEKAFHFFSLSRNACSPVVTDDEADYCWPGHGVQADSGRWPLRAAIRRAQGTSETPGIHLDVVWIGVELRRRSTLCVALSC